MSKLTVGFVLDDRLDKSDGVQQYIISLGDWLSAHGHEVHYLVGESPAYKGEPRVHHLSRTVNVRFNKNRMSIPRPASKKVIKQLLTEHKFDILHVQLPYSPLLAGRVMSLASPETAVVGTFHILPFSATEKSATKILGTFLKKSKKRFDKVFSVSPAAQEFAASHFGLSSEVLPNVVDIKRFRNSASKSKQVQKIVFLGRLVKRKGVLELLQAYSKLLDNKPDFADSTELVIGGKGPLLKKVTKMKQQIEKSHPKSKINLAGFISEADKPEFLGSADLAVFPATGGESFGIVLIEAMASNSDVVLGGDNPGYSSVLGGNVETLFSPKKTNSFADKLQQFLEDKSLRKAVHDAQQQLVKAYDVNTVGAKLEASYQELVASKQKTKHNKS